MITQEHAQLLLSWADTGAWRGWLADEWADFVACIGFPQYREAFALNITSRTISMHMDSKGTGRGDSGSLISCLSGASVIDFRHQRIIWNGYGG
jgi:hypothetical protein